LQKKDNAFTKEEQEDIDHDLATAEEI